MEFCPECGAMMLPNNGVLKCNSCGHSKNLGDNNEYAVSEEIKETESVKVLSNESTPKSTIREICPECGHDKASYELKQMRSADEAPTRFFECAKCGYKWRESD